MEPKELLTRLVEAWNQHDGDAMAGIWAEDAELLSPLGRAQGRQGIVESLRCFWLAASDSTLTVLDYAEADGAILARWADDGHHTGPLMTASGMVQGSGAAFHLEGMSITEVGPDGLIERVALYFDSLDLFRQLGIA